VVVTALTTRPCDYLFAAYVQCFLQWVESHHDNVPDVDFFAVSLPDLVVLDTSAQAKHQQHCLFINVGNSAACQRELDELLQLNPAHDKALLLRHAINVRLFQ